MAKPDTDDGWTPLAHELLAAVFCAKIPHEARTVLSVVFLQIYGPAKRKAARLDPAEVAKMTGLKRPNVWRGITFLIGHGMLLRQPDGLFRFVKDYERWGADGEAILSPGLRSFAVFAPTLAMAYRHEGTPPKGTPGRPKTAENERINPDTPSDTADESSVSTLIRAEYQDGYAPSINPDTRIPIGRIEKEKTTLDRGGEAAYPYPDQKPARKPVAVLKPTPDGPADPAQAPPYPSDRDILDLAPGTHTLDDADARELFALLWVVSRRADVCRRFYVKQRHHAAATWRRAIQEAEIRGVEVTGLGLIQAFARDIECGRIKDDAPPQRAPAEARASPGAPAAPRRNAPMSPEAKAKALERLRENN